MADETSARAVQAVLTLPFLIMGLSHILRPAMWRTFFTRLHAQGEGGVITRCFMLELAPASALVAFHQVWSGPGVLITLYGLLLMTKVAISMLAPNVGLRSLAMAETYGDNSFRIAGVLLVLLGGLCAWLALQRFLIIHDQKIAAAFCFSANFSDQTTTFDPNWL